MSNAALRITGGILIVGIAAYFLIQKDESQTSGPGPGLASPALTVAPRESTTVEAISAPGVAADTKVAQGTPGSPLVPIPVPADFHRVPDEKMFWHADKWQRLHRKLEQEPIDPAWGPSAERSVWNAINQNPELTRYGTPVVNCRTATCEVQLLAYGATSLNESKWSTQFGTVVRNLRADFALEEFSVADDNGAAVMVLYLSRKN
jgi:hypothetical protein